MGPMITPDPVSVRSGNIEAVAHDSVNSLLYVWFKTPSLYRYTGVRQATYDQLLAATSKGRFHHDHIRGRFPYTRLA